MKHGVARLTLLCGMASLGVFAAPVSHQIHAVRGPFAGDTLTRPVVMANASTAPRTVEVTLTAAPARLPLVDGKLADVYAYNGRLPGPTLEVREGDRVVVHFRNDLPEETTVHWHGLHIPFDADGSPYHLVPPGGTHEYVFTLRPGSAGTYWYHPHPNHTTGKQVAKGLYGVIIVRPPVDPLPSSLTEKLLVLADNRFHADGSIDLASPHSMEGRIDRENGREGNLIFVNGQLNPTIRIRSGEIQRWRIVNASASRIYRLAIPGHTFIHVGSDGGLFEHPEEVKEILVANTERVELLVRGTGSPGTSAVLQSLPYDRYIPQTKPRDWENTRNLITLQYTNDAPVTPVKLPATLRHIPPLDPAKATATRVITMSQGMLNGRVMDMNRVDVTAPLGGTEIWQVENIVGMDHPFHLHGFQFQVLERNGVPEKQRRWKDTVNVPKHETVKFIVRYDHHPGKWMFHCHILDHEDHGMMGVLEVK